MKNKTRKILMGVLLVVFLVSTALSLRQLADNSTGDTSYADAVNIALSGSKTESPEATQPAVPQPSDGAEPVAYWVPALVEGDPVMEEMAQINLDALREVNEDVLGWIRIPDTPIDYPLLQGEDNDYYLKRMWDKTPNSVGSIFLECLNSPDFTDYNTIVYGHNMNNGTMFSSLEQFSSLDYWKAHPYVYIATNEGVYRYEIFVFFQPEVDTLAYGMNLLRKDTKERFLEQSLEKSWIDTGIVPPITDRILTLSTCSGMGYATRYVVQARLPMIEVTE